MQVQRSRYQSGVSKLANKAFEMLQAVEVKSWLMQKELVDKMEKHLILFMCLAR